MISTLRNSIDALASRPALLPLARAALATLVIACGVVPSLAADQAALKEADARLQRGQYAEAEELFRAALDERRESAALGLARCLEATGRVDEARRTIDESIAALSKSIDASDARSKKPLAPLYARAAELAWERGDLATAKNRSDEALAADSANLAARWVQAQLLRDSGRLDEATKACEWFIRHYNAAEKITDPDELRYIGLAAAEYARRKGAHDQLDFVVNDLVDETLTLNENFWQAYYEAGRLFLEKYNEPDAKKSFAAAQAINPQAAVVYAALAELSLQNFQWDEAKQLLAKAAKINPNLIEVRRLQADVELANFRVAEAAQILRDALPLQPHDEKTLGRLAACVFLTSGPGDEFKKICDDVARRNPSCGVFYESLATALNDRQRFEDAVVYFDEAIKRLPHVVTARAELGLVLMRLGEEDRAREVLEEAFKRDPYHVRVSNTLKVLEVLDGYQTLETPHFRIKYYGPRDQILAKYAGKFLEERYPALVERFGFAPPGKSLIEIFSQAKNTNGHGWFSARMIGLPYLGTVGACAGKMVALASPNERQYHWGRVLQHEFIHVVTLQQTNFNLPHWFAEGIAVHYEGYPHPPAWDELLARRVPAGDVFTLDDVNFGFIRPKSGNDWQMAYCQSEQYVEHMLDRYGDQAVARLLACYAEGLSTPQALQKAFGVSQAEFEASYQERLERLAATLNAGQEEPSVKEATLAELERAVENAPGDLVAITRLAEAYLAKKDLAAARKTAEKGLAIDAKRPRLNYVLARVRQSIGDDDEARTLLERGLDRESPDPLLLAALAEVRVKAKDYPAAEELYALGVEKRPGELKWLQGLARVKLLTGDDDGLAGVLEKLADRDVDNLTVRKKLAQLAREAADHERTIRWCREAIFADVLDRDAHLWLAEAYDATTRPADAADEYETLAALDAGERSHKLAAARRWAAANEPEKARGWLKKLLKQDPQDAEARSLLEKLP